MAFPASPTNNQVAVINNISYTYNSTLGAWAKTANLTGSTFALVANTLTVSTSITNQGSQTIGTTLGVTGAVTLSSTLGVAGATTFSSTLGVTGATTLAGMTATTGSFSSTLGVTGLITSTGGISGGAASHTTGAFSSTVSASSFTGAGTGLTGTASSLSIGGSSATLNSLPFSPATGVNTGPIWPSIPRINTDGVTEVGSYIDFHGTSSDIADYNVRLSGLSAGVLAITGAVTISSTLGTTGLITATGGLTTANGDFAIVNTTSGTSAWSNRTGVKNAAADKAVFVGTYNSTAIVGAHNNALNAWADLYINTTGDVIAGTTHIGGAQIVSLGVGVAASGTTGQILATNSITAFYSDKRLKNEIGKIENALDKVDKLTGVLYTQNKLAESFGYNNYDTQVGLYAQDVQIVQPEAVKPAPFDIDKDGSSKSGENYLTVQYEKLIPLLVEAIKELRVELNMLKGQK